MGIWVDVGIGALVDAAMIAAGLGVDALVVSTVTGFGVGLVGIATRSLHSHVLKGQRPFAQF